MLQSTIKHSIQSEIKKTVSLSIPLICSQAIYALSGFVGTALVAQLGKDALAASVLVQMVWIALSVFFFGVLNAVSVLVSHQFGAKNYKAISATMGQAYLLGIIITLLIILILLSMPFFLHLTTQPPAVLNLSYQYMYSLLWTIPGLVSLIVSEQFLAGIGRTRLVLQISLLVVPIEIPLIYLLIFGKLGLPACGIAGIGYGFAITYSLTAIGLTFYLLFGKQFKEFDVFGKMNRINLQDLRELIHIGLPMGLMHAIEVSTFTVATFWMAQFGTIVLAAHQIVLQFLGFLITIVFGMAQAVTIRVGHAMGEKDILGIRYAIYVGILINSIIILFVVMGLYFFPEFFIRLDLNIHDIQNRFLIQQAALLLSIGGVLLLFDNFRIIGFGALRGLKDTRFSMYSSFISFWIIGLSSAYLLGFVFNYKGNGIWWGLTLGIASGVAIIYVRLWYLLYQLQEKGIQ